MTMAKKAISLDNLAKYKQKEDAKIGGIVQQFTNVIDNQISPAIRELMADKGKAKQIFSAVNKFFPLTIANNADLIQSHVTILGAVYYSDQILFNPATGQLKVGGRLVSTIEELNQLSSVITQVDGKVNDVAESVKGKLDKPATFLADSLISPNIARFSEVSAVAGQVSGLSAQVTNLETGVGDVRSQLNTLSSEVVRKYGKDTIEGDKTFNGEVTTNGLLKARRLDLRNTDMLTAVPFGLSFGVMSMSRKARLSLGCFYDDAPYTAGKVKLDGIDTPDTDNCATNKKYVDDAVSDKYSKPSTGIPSTDLSAEVQSSLNKIDEIYEDYIEAQNLI